MRSLDGRLLEESFEMIDQADERSSTPRSSANRTLVKVETEGWVLLHQG